MIIVNNYSSETCFDFLQPIEQFLHLQQHVKYSSAPHPLQE